MAKALDKPILLAYVRERFPLGRYTPLAGMFAAAASAGDVLLSPRRFVATWALSLSLLFQLRLWDDLADIERDRVDHPTRVLPSAPPGGLNHARAAFGVIILLNAAIVGFAGPFPGRLSAFAALNAGLLLWYGALRRFTPNIVVNSIVMLLKYPMLVFLAAPLPEGAPSVLPRSLTAALVYLTFCAYEILHDPRVRGESAALPTLGAVLVFIVAVASWMSAYLFHWGSPWALAHTGITIATTFVLATLFIRSRRRGALTSAGLVGATSGKGVFVVCLLLTTSFVLGLRA